MMMQIPSILHAVQQQVLLHVCCLCSKLVRSICVCIKLVAYLSHIHRMCLCSKLVAYVSRIHRMCLCGKLSVCLFWGIGSKWLSSSSTWRQRQQQQEHGVVVCERLQWPGVLVLGYRQECGYLQCAIDEDKLCVRVGVWNRGKEGNERQDSERERGKTQRQPKRSTQPV